MMTDDHLPFYSTIYNIAVVNMVLSKYKMYLSMLVLQLNGFSSQIISQTSNEACSSNFDISHLQQMQPDIQIQRGPDGRPNGEAYITFGSRSEAERAIVERNRKLLQNRLVELHMA